MDVADVDGDLARCTLWDGRRSSGLRGCGPVTSGRVPPFCGLKGLEEEATLSRGEVGGKGMDAAAAAADLYSCRGEMTR